MSLPTTVFIVANDKREMHVGYTKDLEVTLSLMDGKADLAARGIDRLVYKEELPSVREAIARVAEINAMSPNARRRLVQQHNPTWTPIKETAPFPPLAAKTTQPKPCLVIVVANDYGEFHLDLTTDLAATLLLVRGRARRDPDQIGTMPKLVFLEAFPNIDEARARLKELKRLGAEGLRRFVTSSNATWSDVTPPHLMVHAAGYEPFLYPELGPAIPRPPPAASRRTSPAAHAALPQSAPAATRNPGRPSRTEPF